MFDLKTLKLYSQMELLKNKMARGITDYASTEEEPFCEKIVYVSNNSPNVINLNRKKVAPLMKIEEIGDVYDTTLDVYYDLYINGILYPELTDENYEEIKAQAEEWYTCKLYKEQASIRSNPYAIVISNGIDNIIITDKMWFIP